MNSFFARFFTVIVAASLLLHIFLIPQLNIIEDESAYMQDAAQITPHVLPFRDFGGTKGPLWLFIFHGWEEVFGHSLLATRLFSSLAHIASIFLLWHLVRSFHVPLRVAYISAALWALSPVVVSLTTNITHIPLELVSVLAALLCLRQSSSRYAVPAALLLLAALLMRATALGFVPAALILILIREDRWALLWRFCLTGLIALLAIVALAYPSYGWPKTAFLFNAEALLMANKQRAVYAAIRPLSSLQILYDATFPIRRDGLSILIPAVLFPVVIMLRVARKKSWPIALSLLLLVWVGAYVVLYRWWGRSPTPFYPLESIPALTIAAAITIEEVLIWSAKLKYKHLIVDALALLFAANLFMTFHTIGDNQYRGTVEVSAAKEVSEYLKANVRPGEQVFTAQPVFVYLADLPLYGGYTHPGWYLSERAGYLPSEIRRLFYPDMDVLTKMVTKDVTWIILDWRTNDVYFNESAKDTEGLRKLLAKKFEGVAEISNSASRDIQIFRRKGK